MALDGRFVTTVSLDEVFLNKDTGAPNSFGTIEFWQDDNRVVPKNVFQLTGAPPNYTYTALPNPITLSAIGTPATNTNDNVAIYYFPYDGTPDVSLGDVQLYYVVVRDQFGVVQEVREGWPNITAANNPAQSQANISNELSNPQFVDINFLPNNPSIFTLTGAATTTIPIAPKWDLVVQHTAGSTVTVTRTAIAGVAALPGNPPYTLTVTPGANIASLVVRQRLENNPAIFARPVGGANGWISGSILLGNLSSLSMSYQPNGEAAQQIFAANNVTGAPAEFNGTIQLAVATNPSTGDTGYVDILLTLPIVGATTFSNVQIVGLDANIENVGYDQTTANRQRDQLFNYYNSLLQAKPIRSYLIGWDFPLNPAQPLTSTVAASAAGANSSYTWDQTIVFQTVNNGAATSRATSGAMRITATNATQFALIQYLPQKIARELLNGPLSVNIAALTPQVGGLVGTVSLWYTNNVALPNIAANASVVTALDANGFPTVPVGWTEVPRSGLGNAQFTVANSATTNFNDYPFFGWNLNGIAAVNTTTFFAIVVGFSNLLIAGTVDFQSISLVPGSIPTRPAPLTQADVNAGCYQFYQKSFPVGVLPAQNLGAYSGDNVDGLTNSTNPPGAATTQGAFIRFPVEMNVNPTIVSFNPAAANANMRNYTRINDVTNTLSFNITTKGFILYGDLVGGHTVGDSIGVHWTANSRLGF